MCRIKYIIILIIYMFIVSFTFSKSSSETVYIDIAVKKSDSFLVMNKNLDSRTYHLITHGRPGQLLIEGKWLNAEQITDFLKPKIQNSEFKIQNLNIYGCEFAKGEEGINAVKYIESKLDVKVSASTNLTGKDGDWVLEVGVKANFSFLKDYPYTLQTGPNDDLDGDTVLNKDDLDDDNDGILDTNELICAESPQTLITFSEATNYSTTYSSGEAFNIGTGTFSTGATGEVFPLAGGTMAGQTRYGFESKPNYIITRARTGATASSPAFVGINFSTPVYNLSFEIDHLNSVSVTGSTPVEKKERVLINATYQGVSVPLASYTLESGVNYNTTNGYFSSNGTDITNSGAVLNFVGPVDQVSFSYSATGRDHTVYENEIHILKNATGCVDGDSDRDGIVNRLDLDSDGDGCPDALEGDGGITSSQLQTSNINGGNTGAEYNGTAGPVIDNLGNNVGGTGIPTIANGGQAVGTSQNASAINEEECGDGTGCSQCSVAGVVGGSEACDDFDGDGIINSCDLDDDNDGILDAIESPDCFYSKYTLLTNKHEFINVSTDLQPYTTNNNISEVIDGYHDQYGGFVVENDITITDKAVYTFEMDGSVELKEVYIVYFNRYTHLSSGELLLQGSVDGNTWVDLSQSITNMVASLISVPYLEAQKRAQKFSVTQNSGEYRHYRIFAPSGTTSYSGRALEVFPVSKNELNSSAYPKDCSYTGWTCYI